jgi:hypothetical protein
MDRRDSAVDHAMPFFRELVESALARQRLAASQLAAFYLVRLLARSIQRSADDDRPLGPRLIEALESGGAGQRADLQYVGDRSLFLSGFFSDALPRSGVDIDYYVAIGAAAYQALSRVERDAAAPLFAELAGKFGGFVDVLNDVSERAGCASNRDLLRLYEKFLRTGSVRTGRLLVERGVLATRDGAPPRVQ